MAAQRPMVAMMPLSWYENGASGLPVRPAMICAAACQADRITTCANCGHVSPDPGESGMAAQSPIAKTSGHPDTARVESATNRPL
jgi:hypothetical protein